MKLILEEDYNEELSSNFVRCYEQALKQYRLANWQYFGNEIGQFVEIARRMIEFKIFRGYTPFSKRLDNFSETVLIQYENKVPTINDSYRIIIPRCLYSMYCIRNKRGMIHKKDISPNKMDATVLLQQAKWVLAELFRLSSTLSVEESFQVIDSITYKENSLIWDTGNILRVLDTSLNIKKQTLLLLYSKDNQSDLQLFKSTEYSNFSVYKSKVLKTMHKERLIEYSQDCCKLSPKGIEEAEKILSQGNTL
ncbi:MAG: hypothetical protein KBS62_07255 [Oscillospiraceae bacterium]|nr:hypothetical protein [Candidatus Ruminococcus equi]